MQCCIFLKNIKTNTCRYHYQNLDDMIYSSKNIEQNILELVILGHFLLFYPLQTRKIKILKIEKICCRYHHFTDVYQKSQSMMYGFWDMECQRQKVLSLWTIFCPFTPLCNQKIKILKKWKKHLNILSFYKCLPHMTVIWYMVFQIWSATDNMFCHFGPFSALLPFLTIQEIKILKNGKKPLELLSFHNSVSKIIIIYYTVPEKWCLTDVITSDFRPFFALLPLTAWKIKIKRKAWRYHHLT